MKAEIIAVGTEILTGQIVNTNAQFLSEKLASIGVDVFYHVSVGDNESRLLATLATASQRSNLVILCGGLGPTDDDLTKQTLAKYLNRQLVLDEAASQKLDNFFALRPQHHRTPNNERQAQILEGSVPIPNPTGLAVGGLISQDGVTYVVLPGPPSELKPMVTTELLPRLNQKNLQLYSRVLRFFGIGESQLVTILEDLIRHQTDPSLAPYAKTGEVTLRISTKADNPKLAQMRLDQLQEKILQVKTLDGQSLSHLCYGEGEENSLAQVVFDQLKSHQLTISAAESLTAGLFQARLADFPGASEVFKGGFITYSLAAKAELLKLPQADLLEHGTVSAFTAEAMAQQARSLTQSDLGISLTGVAGPDDLEGHPPGTVFIGLATASGCQARKINIGGRSRTDVRHIAVLHAFDMVRQALSHP